MLIFSVDNNERYPLSSEDNNEWHVITVDVAKSDILYPL